MCCLCHISFSSTIGGFSIAYLQYCSGRNNYDSALGINTFLKGNWFPADHLRFLHCRVGIAEQTYQHIIYSCWLRFFPQITALRETFTKAFHTDKALATCYCFMTGNNSIVFHLKKNTQRVLAGSDQFSFTLILSVIKFHVRPLLSESFESLNPKKKIQVLFIPLFYKKPIAI